ncbi:hypothetical protein MTO96_048273 [Rhipicephalus appendiculatus]
MQPRPLRRPEHAAEKCKHVPRGAVNRAQRCRNRLFRSNQGTCNVPTPRVSPTATHLLPANACRWRCDPFRIKTTTGPTRRRARCILQPCIIYPRRWWTEYSKRGYSRGANGPNLWSARLFVHGESAVDSSSPASGSGSTLFCESLIDRLVNGLLTPSFGGQLHAATRASDHEVRLMLRGARGVYFGVTRNLIEKISVNDAINEVLELYLTVKTRRHEDRRGARVFYAP